MPDFTTWVVIQSREEELAGILRRFPRVNLEERPPVSLTLIGESVELRMATPQRVLDRIQLNQPLRAISSAPIEDITKFHGKRFQHIATRYEIQCDACNPAVPPSPYRQRFLSIAEIGTGVATKADDRTPIVHATPTVTNLWLWPEKINFMAGDVANFFGEGGPATQLVNSFFLPPIRFDSSAEKAENYFSCEFCELRQAILHVMMQQWSQQPDAYRDPVALTLTRLTDDMMLRDALLDGGMLKWTSTEGLPTEIDLFAVTDSAPGSSWRTKVLCEPNHQDFPTWARPLTTAIADDVRGLLPLRGLGIKRSDPGEKQDWSVAPISCGSADGMHEEGSWAFLNRLHDHLDQTSDVWNVMFERILHPTQALIGQGHPNHDDAEKLFMQIAWRCPWPYDKKSYIDAWRRAFQRILMMELSGDFRTPEQRVERWNCERKNRTPLFTPLRCKDVPHPMQFVVKYAGEPNDDEVSAWRLELPWRAVVQARTLILDSISRAKLNSRYVLA